MYFDMRFRLNFSECIKYLILNIIQAIPSMFSYKYDMISYAHALMTAMVIYIFDYRLPVHFIVKYVYLYNKCFII